MGGLGLRKTELHSSAAFIALQVAYHKLCPKLDNKFIWDPSKTQTDCSKALTDFNTKVEPKSQMQSIGETCPRQQTLSQAIDDHTLGLIKESRSNDKHYLAHLNLITASGAGSWLHAVPSSALSTHVDPLLYRTMIQRRLRVPLFEDNSHCTFCDEIID